MRSSKRGGTPRYHGGGVQNCVIADLKLLVHLRHCLLRCITNQSVSPDHREGHGGGSSSITIHIAPGEPGCGGNSRLRHGQSPFSSTCRARTVFLLL